MIELIEDLTKIATPDAAEALVAFLWHPNESLRFRAAWSLAELFVQNDITEALQEFELTAEQQKAEYLEWIWHPFNKPQSRSLSTIAGRIVYLLNKTPIESIPCPLPKLDPRLIIPLLSIHNIVDLKFNNRWNSVADSLLLEQEQTSEIEKKITEQVNNILGNKSSLYRWKIILSSLKSKSQLDLLYRLIHLPHPSLNNWRNLLLEIDYQFQRSYHYRLILAVVFFGSLAAIIEMLLLISEQHSITEQPEIPLIGFLGLGIYVISVFWISLWQIIEKRLEPNIFIKFGLLGILTFITEIQRLSQNRLIDTKKASPFYKSATIFTFFTAFSIAFVAAIFTFLLTFGIFFGSSSSVSDVFLNLAVALIAIAFTFVIAAIAIAILYTADTNPNAISVTGVIFVIVLGLAVATIIGLGVPPDDVMNTVFNPIAVATIAGLGAISCGTYSNEADSSISSAVNTGKFFAGIATLISIATGFFVSVDFLLTPALIGTGLGCWHRAKSKKDWTGILVIFAFPYFCAFPIFVTFSTLFMLRYLTWQYTILIWLLLFGSCTALWIYGQNKHRKASNPLKGILDVAE